MNTRKERLQNKKNVFKIFLKQLLFHPIVFPFVVIIFNIVVIWLIGTTIEFLGISYKIIEVVTFFLFYAGAAYSVRLVINNVLNRPPKKLYKKYKDVNDWYHKGAELNSSEYFIGILNKSDFNNDPIEDMRSILKQFQSESLETLKILRVQFQSAVTTSKHVAILSGSLITLAVSTFIVYIRTFDNFENSISDFFQTTMLLIVLFVVIFEAIRGFVIVGFRSNNKAQLFIDLVDIVIEEKDEQKKQESDRTPPP
ncbi:hypothetical protein [Jeotgalibacillus aurantiacus]|uniref:hypothetical protein n=1 Tax=Jeotgalibacillus aurantiacus TaxID=2763266 RepID=UPI001D0B17A4|nr:hypothetical protein [Jeotgalibacillus aurantiacus]